MTIDSVLRIKPNITVPTRWAKEPREDLLDIDPTPCPCGSKFRQHDWVLTFKGLTTVLRCSVEQSRMDAESAGSMEDMSYSPRTWATPEPPPASVRAVRTRHGTIFIRSADVWTSAAATDGARGGFMLSWYELLAYAPLTDATDELES